MPSSLSSSTAPLPSDRINSLEFQLDRALGSTIGATAAISSPQGGWFGASGLANLRTGVAVQPDDLFQIGSISKPFVATVVLQLVEADKLTLDDRIDRWLPADLVPQVPNANQITIRQLLNHTSGLPDYVPSLLSSGVNLFREWQPEELIGLLAGTEASFAPGTDWQYANTNYVLLGFIVETVTRSTLASEIRSRILTPLDMTNTFYAGVEAVPPTVASYWDVNNDGNLEDVTNLGLSWAGAAGSLISNSRDLTRFSIALFGGELLQPDSLAQMLDFEEGIRSNAFAGYGLGVARLKTPDGTFYGHTGLTLGTRSSLWYSPDSHLVYVDLQNTRRFNNLFSPLLATWNGDPEAAIEGTDQNDFLIGSGKNDAMHGNDGDDLLTGGIGNDFLWGGSGRDRFLLTPGEGIDAIGDFVPGEDRISLPNLTFEDIAIGVRDGNTIIRLITGERLAGLIGVETPLTRADFITVPT